MIDRGLGRMLAPPPELGAAALLAIDCWAFCGGWTPERWPLYAALHRIDDWDLLIHCMEVIRRHGH